MSYRVREGRLPAVCGQEGSARRRDTCVLRRRRSVLQQGASLRSSLAASPAIWAPSGLPAEGRRAGKATAETARSTSSNSLDIKLLKACSITRDRRNVLSTCGTTRSWGAAAWAPGECRPSPGRLSSPPRTTICSTCTCNPPVGGRLAGTVGRARWGRGGARSPRRRFTAQSQQPLKRCRLCSGHLGRQRLENAPRVAGSCRAAAQLQREAMSSD